MGRGGGRGLASGAPAARACTGRASCGGGSAAGLPACACVAFVCVCTKWRCHCGDTFGQHTAACACEIYRPQNVVVLLAAALRGILCFFLYFICLHAARAHADCLGLSEPSSDLVLGDSSLKGVLPAPGGGGCSPVRRRRAARREPPVAAGPRARGAQHTVRHVRGAVFMVGLLGLYQHVAAGPCACLAPAEVRGRRQLGRRPRSAPASRRGAHAALRAGCALGRLAVTAAHSEADVRKAAAAVAAALGRAAPAAPCPKPRPSS